MTNLWRVRNKFSFCPVLQNEGKGIKAIVKSVTKQDTGKVRNRKEKIVGVDEEWFELCTYTIREFVFVL